MKLAVSVNEAAESLGLGRSFFKANVMPHLRVVNLGTRVLVPVSELERWLEENAK